MNSRELARKKFLRSVAYVMGEDDPSKETQWLTIREIAVSLFGDDPYPREIAKVRRALITLWWLGAVDCEDPFTLGYAWKLIDVTKVPGLCDTVEGLIKTIHILDGDAS